MPVFNVLLSGYLFLLTLAPIPPTSPPQSNPNFTVLAHVFIIVDESKVVVIAVMLSESKLYDFLKVPHTN